MPCPCRSEKGRGDLPPTTRRGAGPRDGNEVVARDARGLAAAVTLARVRRAYGNGLGLSLWDGRVLLRGSRPGGTGRRVSAEGGRANETARLPHPARRAHRGTPPQGKDGIAHPLGQTMPSDSQIKNVRTYYSMTPLRPSTRQMRTWTHHTESAPQTAPSIQALKAAPFPLSHPHRVRVFAVGARTSVGLVRSQRQVRSRPHSP